MTEAETTDEGLRLEPPSSIAETEELRKNRSGKPLAEILARPGLSQSATSGESISGAPPS